MYYLLLHAQVLLAIFQALFRREGIQIIQGRYKSEVQKSAIKILKPFTNYQKQLPIRLLFFCLIFNCFCFFFKCSTERKRCKLSFSFYLSLIRSQYFFTCTIFIFINVSTFSDDTADILMLFC